MEMISCDVARDLLPLYCDDVCSQDSRSLVEQHLEECEECSALLEKMKTECHISSEQEECHEEMVRDMAWAWRKSVKKSFLKGIFVSLFTCLLLLGAYWSLTRMILIAVPDQDVKITVENITDDHVEIYLEATDGKKVLSSSAKLAEDGKYYITVKRGVIEQKNGNGENWGAHFKLSRVGITEEGKTVQVKEIYYGTAGDNKLIWSVEDF